MGWKLCLSHAALAWLGCIMLFMNGTGSVVYLYLEKSRKLEGLTEFKRLSQKVRGTFNLVYFIGGYTLLTFSMVMGVYQSAKVWGTFLPVEPKMFFSVIVWVHYSLTLFSFFLPAAKNPETGSRPLFALLCSIGSLLVLINIILGNFLFSGKHDFF